jgi:IMP cyclohydrolase
MRDQDWIAANTYPGRGIVVGLSADGTQALQIYWTMGRSAKSRNRILAADPDQGVRTQLAMPDPEVGDTSLILYTAMARAGDYEVVSNGAQTDDLARGLAAGATFAELVLAMRVEPDAPNFTARIAAAFDRASRRYALAAVRAPGNDSAHQLVHTTTIMRAQAGRGHCITTYDGDGEPLPPFTGEPFAVPLGNQLAAIASDYWALLDRANRVSLVVKAVSLESKAIDLHIVNRHAGPPDAQRRLQP